MGLKKHIISLFVLLIAIYISSPFIWRSLPVLQRSFLFMNMINTQYHVNLSHPEQLGIKCTRTMWLDLESDGKSQLGVWHILPESRIHDCKHDQSTNRTYITNEEAFTDSRPIILYIHGNGGNRAGDHRSRLYKKLAYDHDYHIVTFDYRGYGDSTNVAPTAKGLSDDATFMYMWLLRQKNVTNKRLVVWGHSLGTAVAVRTVADLPKNLQPSKLILEAPFDSLHNAVANHPFSWPFRLLPWFEYAFVEPIRRSVDMNFDSGSRIGDITQTPIMIMHAEDDAIIPISLGKKLFERAARTLDHNKLRFVQISGDEGLGHKHICTHEETMTKVREFIALQA